MTAREKERERECVLPFLSGVEVPEPAGEGVSVEPVGVHLRSPLKREKILNKNNDKTVKKTVFRNKAPKKRER